MVDDKTLLPCPFCGGEARTMKQYRWWVFCPECMCDLGFEGMDENGCYGHYDTEAEAIEAWNTRAERTCHDDGDPRDFCCSECGARMFTDVNDTYTMISNDEQTIIKHPNYCSNCGAKVIA